MITSAKAATLTFQSHYGLILSQNSAHATQNEKNDCFQSHYGLILSRTQTGGGQTVRAAFNPTMV